MRLALGKADERPRNLWMKWGSFTLNVIRERALWLALVAGLVMIVLAYQSPRPLLVDIGSQFDTQHMVGFHEPERNEQATYRWSRADSSIVFQGAGKPLSPLSVQLQLTGGPTPSEVAVRVNGHEVAPLKLTPASAAYTINVDPAWVDLSGDLRLDFASPTFKQGTDRRELGFLADFARVDRPAGFVIPSLTQLLGLLLSAALLYMLLRAVWLTPRGAGLLAGLFIAASAGVIAVQRLLLTTFTDRLVITLLIALVVGVVAEVAVRSLVGLAGWRGEKRLPEWAWTWLRGLVMLSVLLKVGGLLYPNSFVIDAPFHVKYITYMNEVFFHGRSFEQYFGESLAMSVMPKDEWGSARAFIPYSPFFYVVGTPLAWLPLPLTTTVPVAMAILDSLKVALVFVIGLALGRAPRNSKGGGGAAKVAVAAAGVYSIVPAMFLLQQWGNWPTQTALWLMSAWVAFTALFWERIRRPAVWVTSTLLLALSLLAYTVSAAYTGLFGVALVVLGWLFAGADRRRWTALLLSGVAAAGIALLAYYGQYVERILNDTIPTFSRAAETQGSLTTLRPTFWDFVSSALAAPFYSYNMWLMLVLGLAGTLWVFLGPGRGRWQTTSVRQPREVYALIARHSGAATPGLPWQRIWVGAWLLVIPLITLADFYIDQVLKQFWYAMPVISMVAGIWLLSLLARRVASRFYAALVTLLVATLAWQSLSLWVFRLLFHNR
ncbi:MAG TPA: hypothetical protein VGE04_10530 [Chloroflexia bacterium]|jgi:hypothetical protein